MAILPDPKVDEHSSSSKPSRRLRESATTAADDESVSSRGARTARHDRALHASSVVVDRNMYRLVRPAADRGLRGR